jgi:hypothetical protein
MSAFTDPARVTWTVERTDKSLAPSLPPEVRVCCRPGTVAFYWCRSPSLWCAPDPPTRKDAEAVAVVDGIRIRKRVISINPIEKHVR